MFQNFFQPQDAVKDNQESDHKEIAPYVKKCKLGKLCVGKIKVFEYLDYMKSELRNRAVCKEVREVNCALAGTGHKSARLPDWPQTSFSHDRHQEHN